jgi:hypothetical protein
MVVLPGFAPRAQVGPTQVNVMVNASNGGADTVEIKEN